MTWLHDAINLDSQPSLYVYMTTKTCFFFFFFFLFFFKEIISIKDYKLEACLNLIRHCSLFFDYI